MRIQFVINQLVVGGAEQQLVALCEGLHRRGHESSVISIYDKLDLRDRLSRIGAPVSVAGKSGKLDVSVVWRLRRMIQEAQPDLVHAFLPASCLFAGLAKRIGFSAPLILAERSLSSWRSRARIQLDNFSRRQARFVLANVRAIERRLVEIEGVPAEKIRVVYNGLAPSRRERASDEAVRQARQRYAIPPGACVIACVANFVKEKDHPTLLEAFAQARRRVHNLFLLLVGRGGLEAEIRTALQRLDIENRSRVITDCSNPAALLCGSDAAILTSSIEGCSNAVLEAMALGLPVIASDAGGNPELVDSKGGIVCRVGDVDGFADALSQLAVRPEQGRRMGAHNAEIIRTRFTDDVMVEQTLSLYGQALETVPTPAAFGSESPAVARFQR